jgi:osmotically-inducible protein OsmY
MTHFRYVILTAAAGLAIAGSACTQNAAHETTNAAVDKSKAGADVALDATRTGADQALDATKAGTDKALDATKQGVGTAIDETQKAAEKTADATKGAAERVADKTGEIAGKTAAKTKEVARDIATKTKEVTSTTGEVITDAWITTKVKAKLVDETLLKGSDINVDTDNRVVTLKGTVTSAAGQSRAAEIARGSEGVTRVVNQLVVK